MTSRPRRVAAARAEPVYDHEAKTDDWKTDADLVVLGSGVAGLTAAIRARELGLRVLVVTKAGVSDGSTRWAQGGVAVVLDENARTGRPDPVAGRPDATAHGVGTVPEGHADGIVAGGHRGSTVVDAPVTGTVASHPDSTGTGGPERVAVASGHASTVVDDAAVGHGGDSVAGHARDTVAAGAGLCDEAVVRSIVAEGPAAVARLRARGARFDTSGAGLARTREGGHRAFRVIHAGGDATGAEVQRALVAAAHGREVPVLEQHIAVDAVRTAHGEVAGVTVLAADGTAGLVRAPAVLVATGGFGQLYHATSNPDQATGDGLALALRAGAGVADIEFVQFHPTVLYSPGASGRCPLVTEALRGEGAVLIDATGEPVLRGVHPLGDLAPRDVVSAAVTRRMAAAPGGVDDHVFLDATGLDGFARRFPTVHAACVAAGVDPVREPIPVTPAAHFACGGVRTGIDGRSDVPGLYAAGEVARTGLHGANRLASNSLLEGLVQGRRAAESAAADVRARRAGISTGPVPGELRPSVASVADRTRLRGLMSRYAAVGRDAEGLSVAGSVLDLSVRPRPLNTVRAVEDAALTLVARALLAAAGKRAESRGCHVRTDAPGRDDAEWGRSLTIRLNPSGQPVLADSGLEHAA